MTHHKYLLIFHLLPLLSLLLVFDVGQLSVLLPFVELVQESPERVDPKSDGKLFFGLLGLGVRLQDLLEADHQVAIGQADGVLRWNEDEMYKSFTAPKKQTIYSRIVIKS